jgi:hypothetical protein
MPVPPPPPAHHPSLDTVRRYLARSAERHRDDARPRRDRPAPSGPGEDGPGQDRRALWQSRLAAYTRARRR